MSLQLFKKTLIFYITTPSCLLSHTKIYLCVCVCVCVCVVEWRAVVGNYGIPKDYHLLPIKLLSDGLKTRLVFCEISLQNPHLLLFDEPTNAADMEVRMYLICGCVVVCVCCLYIRIFFHFKFVRVYVYTYYIIFFVCIVWLT